jgi:hypothetical protein
MATQSVVDAMLVTMGPPAETTMAGCQNCAKTRKWTCRERG